MSVKKISVLLSVAITTALAGSMIRADDVLTDASSSQLLREADATTPEPGVSPIRRITRGYSNDLKTVNKVTGFREIDGSNNNLTHTSMGAAHAMLMRICPPEYSDNLSALAGVSRPSARAVSNAVSMQNGDVPNTHNTTDFVWQWGQFLDHDIDLTDGTNPPEQADILVPMGDPFFDPNSTGTQTISMNRSIYDASTGTTNPRQQTNEITAWIDASNVYGSDTARANELRTNDGTGQLKTSAGDLLPFNVNGLPNAGGSAATLFLAGDVRANEQVGLTAMHTLFVREHNRLAVEFATANPSATGEEIYQLARRHVGALMQKITYRDFIPRVLGSNALSAYTGYDSTVDASISNSFSTAVYRWGHSALSPQLMRVDIDGNEIAQGHLPLRNAFFSPQRLNEGGIEPVLRGLAAQQHQSVDTQIIDDVRNFLFGAPGSGGFDLAALNIQRGRDHGLPDYNNMRIALGLPPAVTFSDISSDPATQQRLASVYSTIDQVDAWVGGLAEDPVNGGMVGEMMFRVMKMQFEALRNGDRFWYENALDAAEIDTVNSTTLADIIRRNTQINTEIQNDVFVMRSADADSSGGGGGGSALGLLWVIAAVFFAVIRIASKRSVSDFK